MSYFDLSYFDLIRNKDKEFNNQDTRIKKFFFQSIDYIDIPTFICPSCNFETMSQETGVICKKCFEYNENKTVKDIEQMCEDYIFVIQSFENIDISRYHDAELYKINVGIMSGIAIFAIFLEPNEWSSYPHDDYITKIYLFNTEEKRDLIYDKYKDQLVNNKANIEMSKETSSHKAG